MPEFRIRVKRRDMAYIRVEAASAAEAEDQVWDWIENDYDRIDDLHWEGDHDVDMVSG